MTFGSFSATPFSFISIRNFVRCELILIRLEKLPENKFLVGPLYDLDCSPNSTQPKTLPLNLSPQKPAEIFRQKNSLTTKSTSNSNFKEKKTHSRLADIHPTNFSPFIVLENSGHNFQILIKFPPCSQCPDGPQPAQALVCPSVA